MVRARSILVAVVAVVAAFGVRWALDPVLHDRAPFLFFTLAVLAASVAGGTRVGLMATLLSAVTALWAFVPPRGSAVPASAEYALEAASFVAMSVAVSLLAGRMRAARVRAEAGEAEVRRLNRDLERMVAERTADLEVANTQLEAFAYTVSHDLRAPLRGMEGFARILLDDFADGLGPKGKRHAERIVAAAQRMEALISDLLTFSRLQRIDVSLRAIDPTGIVRTAANEAHALAGPEDAIIRIDEPLPKVAAEPTVLKQVVGNLLTNAVKFRKDGEPAQVRVWGQEFDGHVRLWVEDQGIGIAPEHQERIFGTFERLHGQEAYPGNGIGLAIVKAGAERMGGRAGVESTPEAGARFWVELAAPKPAA
ncbi:PAS domain-containing sensor histidine kinase [Rubellimicrobium mesophilum]|nr:PAS domain-containing sensor histidine kinase [Rubellimicrobium mesophilum]